MGVKALQPQMAKEHFCISASLRAGKNSLFQLGRVLVVSMISLFGTVHISANAVANNLDGMGCIVGQASALHDHCGGALCGRPTAGPGQLLYQKLLLWDYIAQGATNA